VSIEAVWRGENVLSSGVDGAELKIKKRRLAGLRLAT
jgi:hypothetical protein